jgi:lysophospholipase L1-like esterase
VNSISYLALGDSYTIGELVEPHLNFPNQTKALLEAKGCTVKQLDIIAKTGWTTDELIGPMEMQVKHHDYDWVTLLIGVNNQYRGRSVEEYEIHFRYLANRAQTFAADNAKRVIVLSIPDWGMTPFNKDRNVAEVSAAIDAYNFINKSVADELGMPYIDITPSTRQHAQDASFLASDLLHPGAAEYAAWAKEVAKIMLP